MKTSDALNRWRRRIERRWLFFLGTLLVLILVLVVFRAVLAPFLLAVLLSYVLYPFIALLSKVTVRSRPLPDWISALVVYAVILGLLAVISVTFVPRLAAETGVLIKSVPRAANAIQNDWLPRMQIFIDERIQPILSEMAEEGSGITPATDGSADDAVLDRKPREAKIQLRPTPEGGFELAATEGEILIEPVRDGAYRVRLSGDGDGLQTGVLDLDRAFSKAVKDLVDRGQTHLVAGLKLGQHLLIGTVEAIFSFFLTLMLGYFILADTPRVHRFFESLVPPNRLEDYRDFLRRVDRGLGSVIRGQLTICVINGILSGIGFYLLKIPYWPILTLIATVFSLIPIFGAIISSVPAVLCGLTVSFTAGLFTLLWIVGIHLIEANILNPKIMGTSTRIHPVVILFSILAGGEVAGIMGMLFAVPVASIVQNLYLFLFSRLGTAEARPPADCGPPATPSAEESGE